MQITHTARARKRTHTQPHTCPKAHYIRCSLYTTRTSSSRECALIRFGYGEIESEKSSLLLCVGSSSAAAASIFLKASTLPATAVPVVVVTQSEKYTIPNIAYLYVCGSDFTSLQKNPEESENEPFLSRVLYRSLFAQVYKHFRLRFFSHTSFLLTSFFRFLFRLSECWRCTHHPPTLPTGEKSSFHPALSLSFWHIVP